MRSFLGTRWLGGALPNVKAPCLSCKYGGQCEDRSSEGRGPFMPKERLPRLGPPCVPNEGVS